MESGAIADNEIVASTVLNASTPAKNSRLNYTAGSSWCASTNDSNPYLQIDLQKLHIICAVSTQGNSQADQWVETYILQSSADGTTWTDYEEDGQVKVMHALVWLLWSCVNGVVSKKEFSLKDWRFGDQRLVYRCIMLFCFLGQETLLQSLSQSRCIHLYWFRVCI